MEYLQQDLSNPASILMAIEEAMHIIKEEHNTEINISIIRDWSGILDFFYDMIVALSESVLAHLK